MKIYGISGLGADHRVFEYLNAHLSTPITYVPWIVPDKNESLRSYAHRMSSQLPEDDNFILIGLSFGGMISSEIIKIRKPKKTVLLSSAGCRKELPAIYRGAGKVHAAKFVPRQLLHPPLPLLHFGMSVKKKENKELVDQIMKDTDDGFLKWAIEAITTWDATEAPSDIVRIHGDKDLVIPLKVEVDHLLPGGHMIVLEEAESIAQLISEITST